MTRTEPRPTEDEISTAIGELEQWRHVIESYYSAVDSSFDKWCLTLSGSGFALAVAFVTSDSLLRATTPALLAVIAFGAALICSALSKLLNLVDATRRVALFDKGKELPPAARLEYTERTCCVRRLPPHEYLNFLSMILFIVAIVLTTYAATTQGVS